MNEPPTPSGMSPRDDDATAQAGLTGSDRPIGAGRQFLRGLRRRNPLILLAAAALTVPCLLGLQWLFTSGTYSKVPLEHVLRRAGDDYMHVSWWVARMKLDPPQQPLVVVLGGSAARESIVSGASLAREVQADGGPQLEGFDFGTFNQTVAASLAAIDDLPANGGVMVVGVSPTRFTPSPTENGRQSSGRRLVIRSEALIEAIDTLDGPQDTAFGILPGIATYIASYIDQNRGSLLRLQVPTVDYRLHRYTVAGRQSVARKEATAQRWLRVRAPDFRRHYAYNIDLLDELVELAVDRGFSVILLELPWNRDIIGDRYAWAQDRYRDGCLRIAAGRPEVRYVDFNARLDLSNDDFYDLFHLVGTARWRWQTALAEEVAASLAALPPDATAAARPPGDTAAARPTTEAAP